MKKSNLFTALFVCCAALLSLSSCAEKETRNEPTQIPDHIEFSNLSFQVTGDLATICSDIKLRILLNESSRSYFSLSADNGYAWSKSFYSPPIPAATGGFGVRFTLLDREYPLNREFRLRWEVAGEVKVIDTKGEVMSVTSLKQYSGVEVVQAKDLGKFIEGLNEYMHFFYKCDTRGFLISYKLNF